MPPVNSLYTPHILVPTYFICGKEHKDATDPINEIPNGGQICKNLTYLGRAGLKEIEGLTVAFLSGAYEASQVIVL